MTKTSRREWNTAGLTALFERADAADELQPALTQAASDLQDLRVLIERQPGIYAVEVLRVLGTLREKVDQAIFELAEYTHEIDSTPLPEIARASGMASSTVYRWAEPKKRTS